MGINPFIAETLTLLYSSAGFYIVGVLVLIAHATYCTRNNASGSGLIYRSIFSGGLLLLSTSGRASAVLLLPGFL
jgi:hypothetical protein